MNCLPILLKTKNDKDLLLHQNQSDYLESLNDLALHKLTMYQSIQSWALQLMKRTHVDQQQLFYGHSIFMPSSRLKSFIFMFSLLSESLADEEDQEAGCKPYAHPYQVYPYVSDLGASA